MKPKKQPKHICRHCATELRATFIHRTAGNGIRGFTTQPGFECTRCMAIYDINGNELETPIRDKRYDDDPFGDLDREQS